MENRISICCNVKCPDRFTCAQFSRAMDINSGKLYAGENFYIIDKCSYEKAK